MSSSSLSLSLFPPVVRKEASFSFSIASSSFNSPPPLWRCTCRWDGGDRRSSSRRISSRWLLSTTTTRPGNEDVDDKVDDDDTECLFSVMRFLASLSSSCRRCRPSIRSIKPSNPVVPLPPPSLLLVSGGAATTPSSHGGGPRWVLMVCVFGSRETGPLYWLLLDGVCGLVGTSRLLLEFDVILCYVSRRETERCRCTTPAL